MSEDIQTLRPGFPRDYQVFCDLMFSSLQIFQVIFLFLNKNSSIRADTTYMIR